MVQLLNVATRARMARRNSVRGLMTRARMAPFAVRAEPADPLPASDAPAIANQGAGHLISAAALVGGAT